MNTNNKGMFAIEGVVQHYAWGGKNFIPQLLKTTNDGEKPVAEYWLGAHENAPAIVKNAGTGDTTLSDFIRHNPELLGAKVAASFGRLPYLLKVLDVKDMLSIQVHPSLEDARKGFAREDEQGIARDSGSRNYKDDNHKPELMYAIGEFWLLHGFKPADKLKQLLSNVEELAFLLPVFGSEGYSGVYAYTMEMPQEHVNKHLQPLLNRIVPLYQQGKLDKTSEDFWAARAALTFNQESKIDRGIFSIYLFNLVHLQPGEAIFQDAGIPHAYLEGQNIELMANSDNVLRGGLTPKHIDVDELLKNVKYQETQPNIITGSARSPFERAYETPAGDFELSRIDLSPGEETHVHCRTAEIFLTFRGKSRFSAGDSQLTRSEGEALIAFAGTQISIEAIEDTSVFRATVPELPE